MRWCSMICPRVVVFGPCLMVMSLLVMGLWSGVMGILINGIRAAREKLPPPYCHISGSAINMSEEPAKTWPACMVREQVKGGDGRGGEAEKTTTMETTMRRGVATTTTYVCDWLSGGGRRGGSSEMLSGGRVRGREWVCSSSSPHPPPQPHHAAIILQEAHLVTMVTTPQQGQYYNYTNR